MMKENIKSNQNESKYDDEVFFDKYSKMDRSVKGLQGAGEWHMLKKMFPSFENKTVLDIGCGFGWHCQYAADNGASRIVGIDVSEKMLQKANQINHAPNITYQNCAIETYEYPKNTFDIVISSLALHYVASFDEVCKKVYDTLKVGGSFIFSVEHPIFTANGLETWEFNDDGSIKNWPIDNYFIERKITSNFLGIDVIKYHKTLTTFVSGLINNGFVIENLVEPMPSNEMLNNIPEMKEELKRPMMLLISAIKSK